MLQNMSIGKRLGLATGILLTLMILVAVAGYWGTGTTSRATRDITNVEAPELTAALEARAWSLMLRRFEKDVFLNIATADKVADYSTKWQNARQSLDQTLASLDRVAQGDVDVQFAVGRKDEVGDVLTAMQRMIASTKSKVDAAVRIAGGDLTTAVTPASERDALGSALQTMVAKLSQVIGEVRAG